VLVAPEVGVANDQTGRRCWKGHLAMTSAHG
jgi:hypothetical protein